MDDLFFYSSKAIWKVISPDNLFALLLLTTAAFFYLGFHVYARRLLSLLCVAVLFLSLFPVGSWMLYPLESRFTHNPELPERLDGIILLGGPIDTDTSQAWQQIEINDSAERLTSFIELASRYPEARLIFTGGNASIHRDKPTEAGILSLHLQRLGLDPKRVEFESKSRNTAENAHYTKQLVNAQMNSNWLLITTALHMPRSIGVFCQNDWSLIPYPVDHRTVPGNLLDIDFNLLGHAAQLSQAFHEWLGLIAYYITGKIPDLLPGSCQ